MWDLLRDFHAPIFSRRGGASSARRSLESTSSTFLPRRAPRSVAITCLILLLSPWSEWTGQRRLVRESRRLFGRGAPRSQLRHRIMATAPNTRGAGKGGFAPLFHVVHPWPALPDRERSA